MSAEFRFALFHLRSYAYLEAHQHQHLQKQSILPNLEMVVSIRLITSDSTDTSHLTKCPPICLEWTCPSESDDLRKRRVLPSFKNSSTAFSPIPDVAPVIMQTLPSNLPMVFFLVYSRRVSCLPVWLRGTSLLVWTSTISDQQTVVL